jgi:hypothetical protein
VTVRLAGDPGAAPSGTLWLDDFVFERATPSLLQNGNFELGPNGAQGWLGKIPEGVTVAADSMNVVEGRQALRIELRGSNSIGLWESIDVIPGARYRLSGWIRTNGLEDGALLEARTDEGPYRRTTQPITGTTDWTPVSLGLDIPENATTLMVVLARYAPPKRLAEAVDRADTPGTVWFDSCALERVDEPKP